MVLQKKAYLLSLFSLQSLFQSNERERKDKHAFKGVMGEQGLNWLGVGNSLCGPPNKCARVQELYEKKMRC